jgi:hypothetical protein
MILLLDFLSQLAFYSPSRVDVIIQSFLFQKENLSKMTAEYACFLDIVALALPLLFYFREFVLLASIIHRTFSLLKMTNLKVNTLGELMNNLLKDRLAHTIPDFLESWIEESYFILDIFKLILITFQSKFLQVKQDFLRCDCEGLRVRQYCLDHVVNLLIHGSIRHKAKHFIRSLREAVFLRVFQEPLEKINVFFIL